jgi:hypothetical protein
MSEPVKMPMLIAIVVAAVVVFGLIGYKFVAASNPPPRKIDPAMQSVYTAMDQAKKQKMAGDKTTMPAANAPHQ